MIFGQFITVIFMGKNRSRYIAKAEPGLGWRVWNTKMKQWWGEPFSFYPDELLAELNGPKRPDKLVELTRKH